MKEDIEGLIDTLDVPYNKVSELSSSIWKEIENGTHYYNLKRELVDRLTSMNYPAFVLKA